MTEIICKKCKISKLKVKQFYVKKKLCGPCNCKEWHKNNKKKEKIKQKQYYISNKEEISEYNIQWKKENSLYNKQQKKKWYERNKPHIKQYRLVNRGKYNAYSIKRKTAKLNRTPSWLTKDDWKWIEWYYIQAQRLTKLTGIPHEVDHIVPLQGKNVSGLHCPLNLQILTKSENLIKSNNYTYSQSD